MEKHRRNRPQIVAAGNVSVKIYRRNKAGYEVFELADYSHGARRARSFSNPDAASYGRAMELLRPTGLLIELSQYAGWAMKVRRSLRNGTFHRQLRSDFVLPPLAMDK